MSDIEVARMWRSLSATPLPLPRRRPSRPPLLLGLVLALVAAAAAFGVVLLLSPPEEGTAEVAASDVLGVENRELELPDGSRLTFGPGARLRTVSVLADDVELALLGGAMDVVVTKAVPESRRFVIAASGYDVVSRGGRFRVALSGEGLERRVEVTVQGGQVEVHDQAIGGQTRHLLAAGESWTSPPAGTTEGAIP
jgi:ferric-dicitrate binding protein FerR (iron transport regulator)